MPKSQFFELQGCIADRIQQSLQSLPGVAFATGRITNVSRLGNRWLIKGQTKDNNNFTLRIQIEAISRE